MDDFRLGCKTSSRFGPALNERAESFQRAVQKPESTALKRIAVLDYTLRLSILQPHSFDGRDPKRIARRKFRMSATIKERAT